MGKYSTMDEEELILKTKELVSKTGENFAQILAQFSFDFWSKSEFRKMINFDSISQTEQDRIFNELEVSVLGLFILNLDYAVEHSKTDEQEVFYSRLKRAIIDEFLNLYKKLGIEKKFVDQWRILIDMRLEEYRKDFKIALKESKTLKDVEDDELRGVWAKVETITIDCLSHIRRGDVKEGDPLWKYLRKRFTYLEATFDKLTLQVSVQPVGKS